MSISHRWFVRDTIKLHCADVLGALFDVVVIVAVSFVVAWVTEVLFSLDFRSVWWAGGMYLGFYLLVKNLRMILRRIEQIQSLRRRYPMPYVAAASAHREIHEYWFKVLRGDPRRWPWALREYSGSLKEITDHYRSLSKQVADSGSVS